ncbi:MAG TPA: pyruvate kinase [Acidimicrobiales bacterium]|nr:pyruvate kinase [Acidimicrobiales bacterium]
MTAPVRGATVAPGAKGCRAGAEREVLLRAASERLAVLERELVEAGERAAGRSEDVHPVHRASEVNLAQYLALRRHDIRPLQEQLAALGLSSLGRAEAHVLASTTQVRGLVDLLRGEPARPVPEAPVSFAEGPRLLEQKTDALFGAPPPGRTTRIMVTMPSEAATDYALVRDLVGRGMDCARINTAHDGPRAWARMVANVRRAAREEARPCAVLVDLAGPKLRTRLAGAGVQVVKVQPRRDELGRVVEPGVAWLTPLEQPAPAPAGAVAIPVPRAWLETLERDATVRFTDARGSRRALEVVRVSRGGARAVATKTAYLVPGTVLAVGSPGAAATGRVGALPEVERPLRLARGDRFVLCADAQVGAAGGTPRVGCSAPEAVARLRRGDSVQLDDGRIGGTVVEVSGAGATVEVRTAPPDGARLRSEKGIVLPDTDLALGAITAGDEATLSFVAAHADLVGLSFVERPGDVRRLQGALREHGAAGIGVVLKIETARAFEHLPQLLHAAMSSERVGVMIARGDLAVACGFERLAEVQEEILWLSEAAHLPVVWATQVLDQLARSGLPSRAEITDAAMGERAECVMLNKGPYIREATTALDDILHRMADHQAKRRTMLRRLHAWHAGLDGASPATPD